MTSVQILKRGEAGQCTHIGDAMAGKVVQSLKGIEAGHSMLWLVMAFRCPGVLMPGIHQQFTHYEQIWFWSVSLMARQSTS